MSSTTTVADVIVPKGNFNGAISGGPKRKKRRGGYGQQISDESVSLTLGQGHPKCKPPVRKLRTFPGR
jgi:hypothetical protein